MEQQITKRLVSTSIVAEGIVRAELQFSAPPGSVNVFLLRDGPGWFVIDVGCCDDGTLASWDAIHSSGVLEGLPITRILVTHSHYDHLGLAGSLCRHTGAPLMMSKSEWRLAATLEEQHDLYTEQKAAQFLAAGMPADTVDRILQHEHVHLAVTAPLPSHFVAVEQGDILKIGDDCWNVILTGGHSLAQVCLYCAERAILFSVDQILRQLPTFIPPVWSDRMSDPVDDHLQSLARLRTLPSNTFVIPSHGKPFSGLLTRIAEIEDRHRQRCIDIHRFCDEPRTGMDILAWLFPAPASDAWLMFAIEETIAYLEHLVRIGSLRDFWRGGMRLFVQTGPLG